MCFGSCLLKEEKWKFKLDIILLGENSIQINKIDVLVNYYYYLLFYICMIWVFLMMKQKVGLDHESSQNYRDQKEVKIDTDYVS